MSIPETIRLHSALARNGVYDGAVPVDGLKRLAEADEPRMIECRARLEIVEDLAALARVLGSVAGRWQFECRRCLQPFEIGFELPINVAVVGDEEHEERLLSDADPFLIEQDRLPLWRLVEDELLLGVPMIPRCEKCQGQEPPEPEGEASQSVEERPNPFAALKGMKF